MGRGFLNKEEIKSLKDNPYVLDVNEERIIYSAEFKRYFIRRYHSGMKPAAIFREAGFDPAVLGQKRIERASARWREIYGSCGMSGFDEEKPGNPKKLGETRLKETLAAVRHRNRLLEKSCVKESMRVDELQKQNMLLRENNSELEQANRDLKELCIRMMMETYGNGDVSELSLHDGKEEADRPM